MGYRSLGCLCSIDIDIHVHTCAGTKGSEEDMSAKDSGCSGGRGDNPDHARQGEDDLLLIMIVHVSTSRGKIERLGFD